MRSYVRIVCSFIACFGAGALGSIFIDAGVGSWYAALDKPAFTPPAWLFPIVWFVIYALMSVALAIVWIKDPNAEDMSGWVPMFFAHLLANIAWIVFFFRLHVVLIAFIDILLLITAIIILICGALPIDRRASYLLMPYLAWVSYAAILNLSIWLMN